MTTQSEAIRRAYDNALFDQIDSLSRRLDTLERILAVLRDESPKRTKELVESIASARPKDRIERLELEIEWLRSELVRVDTRAGLMRIDRQFRLLPKWVALKYHNWRTTKEPASSRRTSPTKSAKKSLIVVCPVYPGGERPYGGEFIRNRVVLYTQNGFDVTVVQSSPTTSVEVEDESDGYRIVRTTPEGLYATIDRTNSQHICVHQLEKPIWDVIKPFTEHISTSVWVHGFEARDWRELKFNYSEDELKTRLPALEAANKQRRETMSSVFADRKIAKIFVSNYMKSVAEEFTGVRADNSYVIPNVIDGSVFSYNKKTADHRRHILWVRSFSAYNYANDLAQRAVIELSRRPVFEELRFTIYGDGEFFDQIVTPLKRFNNISINPGFVDSQQLAKLHRAHGVMLIPTRWDSQGLTCGEAMSSGLVPVTNAVAAIPEFVDENCGILCKAGDYLGLADGIEYLYNNPSDFLALSVSAAQRSQRQCGTKATIAKEIELVARKNAIV